MNHRFEKRALWVLLITGIVLLPFSLSGKNYKKWLIAFLLNAYNNTFVAPVLAHKNYLSYPVRFLPRIYKSSIIYDYCLCSLVTVWYCKSTLGDNWIKALVKVWWFVIPQVVAEGWLEKNTKLIKYGHGWNWVTSLVTIASAKYAIRAFLVLMDKYEEWGGREQRGIQKDS
ncbi:MAG: hypothetical protein LRY73_08660 [Bacillus sp. (in: Bacteria)]|nr:hypothetical protein [Bacillus sp. (in: firmicutes)]